MLPAAHATMHNIYFYHHLHILHPPRNLMYFMRWQQWHKQNHIFRRARNHLR